MRVPRRPPSVGFMAQPTNRSLHGFEAQIGQLEPPVLSPNQRKTSPPILRSNWRKPSTPVLRPNWRNLSQWFWGQTTDKPSTLVLRLNQETHAPRLLMHGVDRTQRHLTSRSPGHQVPDLCDHLRSPALGLLLLPRFSSLHAMLHLPPTHHETSKHDSPNEVKDESKTTKISQIRIQNSASQWLITIKPKN
jgi:hypothetical protein